MIWDALRESNCEVKGGWSGMLYVSGNSKVKGGWSGMLYVSGNCEVVGGWSGMLYVSGNCEVEGGWSGMLYVSGNCEVEGGWSGMLYVSGNCEVVGGWSGMLYDSGNCDVIQRFVSTAVTASNLVNLTMFSYLLDVFLLLGSAVARWWLPLTAETCSNHVNNNLQQMHFQYIYCISTSTPTCFGPFGPSSGSYTQ
jgi:hypothetical protein